MRDYSKVSPQFWINGTGRTIRGDIEAQMVALYLMTSPHSTMMGVFTCPLLYVAHETGLPFEGAKKGLDRLIKEGFCIYDDPSETVFIYEMASYQIEPKLKVGDKRLVAVLREFESMPESPIKQAFYLRYKEAYQLPEPTPSKGLDKPLGKPVSKPLGSQEQEQEQEQKQEQDLGGASNSEEFFPLPKTIPSDFSPDKEAGPVAYRGKVDLETERQKFVAHFQSTGETRDNWQAAFIKWLLQAGQYQAENDKKQKGGKQQKPSSHDLPDQGTGAYGETKVAPVFEHLVTEDHADELR